MAVDPDQLRVDLAFWRQAIADSKRTVFCHPTVETVVREEVARLRPDWDVVVSASMPADKIYVVDQQALAAELNKPLRWWDG